jgi:hypothetical protein
VTVCYNFFFWLDEIDEIGLNALVWDSKCVLTL